jgi:hypothetical protein
VLAQEGVAGKFSKFTRFFSLVQCMTDTLLDKHLMCLQLTRGAFSHQCACRAIGSVVIYLSAATTSPLLGQGICIYLALSYSAVYHAVAVFEGYRQNPAYSKSLLTCQFLFV